MRYIENAMKTYHQFRKETLRNRDISRAYHALGPEFDIIALLIKRRIEKGLSQQEIARRAGTKQSAISRLESGTYNPSAAFLFKIADALDARLTISLRGR